MHLVFLDFSSELETLRMSAMNARLTDFERHELGDVRGHATILPSLPSLPSLYVPRIHEVKEETLCVFPSCREFRSGSNVAS